MLLTLFQAFFDICRLRRGPQDLPASPELLALAWDTFRERTVCDGADLTLLRVQGDDLVLERLELEVPDHV